MAAALAFLTKDLVMSLSYRASFVMQFVGIFFSVATFYFVAKLFGKAVAPQLASYGGDYFAFVLVGLAFTGYMTLALSSFAQSIREGQLMGTLEVMLLSPTKLSTILLASALWPFSFTSLRVGIYLAMGAAFGVSLAGANVLGALIILVLAVASFSALGILSAGVILVLKKGDPISWVFGGLSGFLAGTYYPIEILPTWVMPVSYLLPLTYALHGMRMALLQGQSILQLSGDILALLGFAIVLLPLSLLAFGQALKRAKREGSLAQY